MPHDNEAPEVIQEQRARKVLDAIRANETALVDPHLVSYAEAIRAMLAFASPAEPAPGAGGGEEAEMLRIYRSALLNIRDWQGEQNPAGNTYRTPIGFKGSPFDYLRKLANDALRDSARIAWGVDTPSLPARREAIARELAQHLSSGVTGTPDDHGMDDCDDFDSKHPAHREVYFEAADAVLRILAIGPSVEGSGEMVPIRTIMPSLESARMALAHLAKTLPEAEPGKLPLIASYASSEASRLAAAILLLSPPSRERRDEMSEQCRHVWITVTKTTYDLPVPYLRCSRCGETKLPTQGPAS